MTQDDTFRRLNEQFYRVSPHTYFRDRLHMLVLRAANPDLIDENIRADTAWGMLRAVPRGHPDASPETEAEAKDAYSRFLVTESQVLLHHTAEALLRMYLAHETNPACPWVEIAALREPGRFPKELTRLAQTMWLPDGRTPQGGCSSAACRKIRQRSGRRTVTPPFVCSDPRFARQGRRSAVQLGQARLHRACRNWLTALPAHRPERPSRRPSSDRRGPNGARGCSRRGGREHRVPGTRGQAKDRFRVEAPHALADSREGRVPDPARDHPDGGAVDHRPVSLPR